MANQKINITDLNLLKITRIRDWAISFDYDQKHYLLHGASELGEGSWAELFEKTYDEKGRYHLNYMGQSNGSEYVKNDYIQLQKGTTIVYSQINKLFFVYMLTYNNLATGIMEKKVEAVRERQKVLQSEIYECEKKLFELRKEYQNILLPKKGEDLCL